MGPNVHDQSWQWLMEWVRDLDERAKEQVIGDNTMAPMDTAFMRGRHSVFVELLRLDAEVRKDEVAFLDSTGVGHEV